MLITMPENVTALRIGHAVSVVRSRLDLSAAVGLDIDLFLGPIGGDEDELAEYTRLHALMDMADAGYIPRGRGLDLIAGLAEEIERAETEDDASGHSYDPEEFAGRWAA
ncbi:hypothetical protein [Streptomyces jumonjinensis]|uniref:hypothetical protein n=1 Tax=Streptomyces jumonjinensis TaxID=1945 RepID=UPI00379ED792